MTETIQIGGLSIRVTRKVIKHVHLSVHPPHGRVTLAAPIATRLEVARAYAISRLGWIRHQQSKFRNQAREAPRRFIARESHSLWGRRHLLTVVHRDIKPFVSLDHKRITLTVRPGSDAQKRSEVIHAWHKSLLHQVGKLQSHRWAYPPQYRTCEEAEGSTRICDRARDASPAGADAQRAFYGNSSSVLPNLARGAC